MINFLCLGVAIISNFFYCSFLTNVISDWYLIFLRFTEFGFLCIFLNDSQIPVPIFKYLKF